MGRGPAQPFKFLIEVRGAEIKRGFIERKALDAAEYLASLGMTMRANFDIRLMAASINPVSLCLAAVNRH